MIAALELIPDEGVLKPYYRLLLAVDRGQLMLTSERWINDRVPLNPFELAAAIERAQDDQHMEADLSSFGGLYPEGRAVRTRLTHKGRSFLVKRLEAAVMRGLRHQPPTHQPRGRS